MRHFLFVRALFVTSQILLEVIGQQTSKRMNEMPYTIQTALRVSLRYDLTLYDREKPARIPVKFLKFFLSPSQGLSIQICKQNTIQGQTQAPEGQIGPNIGQIWPSWPNLTFTNIFFFFCKILMVLMQNEFSNSKKEVWDFF